jgi:hypothetical protein
MATSQVEVLEQRCTDAEKTKEEAREAAAKVHMHPPHFRSHSTSLHACHVLDLSHVTLDVATAY